MVNKFIEQMKAAVKEAKSAIQKVQEDIIRYYNQRRSPTPVSHPGDWVFLNVFDIKTTHSSSKLFYHCLGPFVVECQVGSLVYCLKLLHIMKKLCPVFNIVKLSTVPDNPILGQRSEPLPLPIIIDREKKWKVEEILDSCWHWRRFQFLVKWKGYGREHNS